MCPCQNHKTDTKERSAFSGFAHPKQQVGFSLTALTHSGQNTVKFELPHKLSQAGFSWGKFPHRKLIGI